MAGGASAGEALCTTMRQFQVPAGSPQLTMATSGLPVAWRPRSIVRTWWP